MPAQYAARGSRRLPHVPSRLDEWKALRQMSQIRRTVPESRGFRESRYAANQPRAALDRAKAPPDNLALAGALTGR